MSRYLPARILDWRRKSSAVSTTALKDQHAEYEVALRFHPNGPASRTVWSKTTMKEGALDPLCGLGSQCAVFAKSRSAWRTA